MLHRKNTLLDGMVLKDVGCLYDPDYQLRSRAWETMSS